MALQVWLHGKDLINQGLCSNNATWVGPATYADGKLGKCYSCTGSHYINCTYDFASTNKFTIAFWIYIPTSLSTCNQWERVFYFQNYVINWASYNNLKIYDNSSNQLWWLNGNNFYDKWVHLAIAHNADTITLYINGDHYATVTSTSSPISSGIMYAGDGITDEHGPVKFNDIRLYDHCLSPKEVKEIAKGLVLHYPLNDAYVQSTTNLNKSIGTSWSNWGESTITSNSFISPEGTIGSHVNCSSYTGGGIYVSHSDFSVKPDTTYVISAKMKLTGNTHKNLFYIYEYDSANTSLSAGGKWSYENAIEYRNDYKLYYGIFTTASTASKVSLFSYFYNVGEHWIYDIQVEEGTYPTPFAGYNASRTATTVYDCSGYQNNGTITGSLSCSSDSPRYKISTHFTSSIPSRIMLPSDMSCLSGNNEQTLSCWVKSSGLGSGMSISGLISLGYGNTLFLTASNYQYRIDNGSDLDTIVANQNPYDGNWHLVTATYKSGIASIYIDGVLKNSVSRTFSNRYINEGWNCIGAETNNVNINNINGDISDVRMYATALSAEDIKELYNTSAYVLDNGTLLTYNLEE